MNYKMVIYIPSLEVHVLGTFSIIVSVIVIAVAMSLLVVHVRRNVMRPLRFDTALIHSVLSEEQWQTTQRIKELVEGAGGASESVAAYYGLLRGWEYRGIVERKPADSPLSLEKVEWRLKPGVAAECSSHVG